MVTVDLPGYGHVKVREDMVVRNGDNITIVANKDCLEKGLMTPIVEKLPITDSVTVDTPYGPLQVSVETLKKEGKDKILKDQADLMAQKSAFEKQTNYDEKSPDVHTPSDITKISSGNDVKEISGQVFQPNTIPPMPATTLVSQLTVSSPTFERVWFHRMNAGVHPDLLYGIVDPHAVYNDGQSFTSYHEREIYLYNNSNACEGDVVEVISHQYSSGQVYVWIALYDNWSWKDDFIITSFAGLNDPVEYYLIINPSDNSYQMWLRNTVTGSWSYNSYVDNEFSPYIGHYTGSTELNFGTLSNWFHMYTNIKDTATRAGSNWYAPGTIFYCSGYDPDQEYVEVNSYTDGSNNIYTEHKSEYPDPGDLLAIQSGSLSGTGASSTYSIAGYSSVTVVMVGNEYSDFDLYAKWGSPPTTSSYDARGISGNSLEYFTTTGTGTLYIMVYSFNSGGNWKSWVISGTPNVDSGVKTGTLSGAGSTATYSVTGFVKGYAFSSGPDGSDFDLYTRWNIQPTTSNYDARGYSSNALELAGPASGSGTLYFMVSSFSGSGEYAMDELIF